MLNVNFYKILNSFLYTRNINNVVSITCVNYSGNNASTRVCKKLGSQYEFYGGPFSLAQIMTSTTEIGSDDYASGTMYMLSNNSQIFFGDLSVSNSSAQFTGVIIGDGDVDPTINDYSLSGNIIESFTAQTSIGSYAGSDGLLVNATYAITNTDTEPFTIKEIGLTRQSVASSSSSTRILLDHTKLATPVTINPGETKRIVYSISFAP